MERKPPISRFLNEKDTEELLKHSEGRQLGWCQAGSSKYILPYRYSTHGEGIWRAEVRPTDRWIVTFPRSGTTWIQELVWLMENDLNYEEAAKRRIAERYYFLEFAIINENIDDESELDKTRMENEPLVSTTLDNLPSPRFIKTHLPFELLPPGLLEAGCKVVYVARNPKDVLVSYYHMLTSRPLLGYKGDFASFWDIFRRDLALWCPYWSHIKEAWNLRHRPNLLFLFYEEMKTDLPGAIKKISTFFGRSCTEDEIATLANHLDFESFKSNPMIGSRKLDGKVLVPKEIFVRKGQIGGWKELFTPELEAQADRWIEENLRDTDFAFPYVDLIKRE